MMNRAWIPNLLTFGNLILGFASILLADSAHSHIQVRSGMLILAAALLDGLDGQVARALKIDGILGKELDSLADCITFGLAPAYLAYKVYLHQLSPVVFGHPFNLGACIAVFFPVCAAYRLARFNVRAPSGGFEGLPSPIAGVTVALFPVVFRDVGVSSALFAFVFSALSFLMVSTLRYSKPQTFVFRHVYGARLLLLLIFVAVLFILFRFRGILMLLGLYVLSGILSFVIQFIQDRRY